MKRALCSLVALAILVLPTREADHFLTVRVLGATPQGIFLVENDKDGVRFWLQITDFKNLPSYVSRIHTADQLVLGGNAFDGYTAVRAMARSGVWNCTSQNNEPNWS